MKRRGGRSQVESPGVIVYKLAHCKENQFCVHLSYMIYLMSQFLLRKSGLIISVQGYRLELIISLQGYRLEFVISLQHYRENYLCTPDRSWCSHLHDVNQQQIVLSCQTMFSTSLLSISLFDPLKVLSDEGDHFDALWRPQDFGLFLTCFV